MYEHHDRDVTDLAAPLGLLLPDGFTIHARTVPDYDARDPRFEGDVYNTDVDEENHLVRTRAFCAHCRGWIYKLDRSGADAINHGRPGDALPEDPAYLRAEPGMWANLATGVSCTDADDGGHEPGLPRAVADWIAGKWEFVGVLVEVRDPDGDVIGQAQLWTIEAGEFPHRIDRDTGEVGYRTIDPLTEDYPLCELIPEAVGEAAQALGGPPPPRRVGLVWRTLSRLRRRFGLRRRPPLRFREAAPQDTGPRIIVGTARMVGPVTGTVWSAQFHHEPVFREGRDPDNAASHERHCKACGDVLPADLPPADPCEANPFPTAPDQPHPDTEENPR